jgi:phage antirepressor YoqD-like protein
LRLAADQAEQLEKKDEQLALAAPKVEFMDRYVESSGLKGFREVAKLLGANEARFREFLECEQIMYRLGGKLTAYQNHIKAGRFCCKTGTNQQNGHSFVETKFTSKGLEWIAGLWAVHQLREEGGA